MKRSAALGTLIAAPARASSLRRPTRAVTWAMPKQSELRSAKAIATLVWYGQRDAQRDGDEAGDQLGADGLGQENRAEQRRSERVDGHGKSHRRRARLSQTDGPQDPQQPAAEDAEVNEDAPRSRLYVRQEIETVPCNAKEKQCQSAAAQGERGEG